MEDKKIEKDEEFFDEKKDKKSTFNRVMNIILWIVLFVSCTGLGYKIYHYERDSYKGIEYGPFWSKDRSAD